MKLQNSFFITRRENPSDEDYIAAQLLIRSGMIVKNTTGVYSYLPMGKKVLDNIIKIIKEEHKKYDVEEVLMPSFVYEDVFSKSKRDILFGKDMFKIVDREDRIHYLCPTHEELFATMADLKIKSYKDLHFSLFQISNKYRDELTDNLIRRKEFLMSDTYSFDADSTGMDISYDSVYHVYKEIFKRMDLDTHICVSSPGKMQGILSEEFQVESEEGEDTIVKCTSCSYSSNSDIAEIKTQNIYSEEKNKPCVKVYTPNTKTVAELSAFLGISKEKIIKSMVYKIKDKYKMILVKGNDEVNENKLRKLFNTDVIRLLTEEEIELLGSVAGFIGPIKATMDVVADNSIKTMVNSVVGSNIKDYHIVNATPKEDFKVDMYADVRVFKDTDICPRCGNKVKFLKTLEVANIFKLGTIYSDAFSLKYSDEKNSYNRVYMGSYGIGIDRCICTIVEKHNDEHGIVWPIEVAPYKVCIVNVNMNDKEQTKISNLLYNKLMSLGIDTLLDDRKESVGVKFKDMDLIGIPIRITVGSKVSDNLVELKLRNENEFKLVKINEIIEKISKIIEKLQK